MLPTRSSTIAKVSPIIINYPSLSHGGTELQKAEKLPVLGLFAERNMELAIDLQGTSTQPSLAQMTKRALDLLQNQAGGFFLVVEGNALKSTDLRCGGCAFFFKTIFVYVMQLPISPSAATRRMLPAWLMRCWHFRKASTL